jgi:uridylate kinase
MTYIISLGGSIICPDKMDIKFLKKFKQLILKRVKLGDRFIIVTGGGMTAREYQKAARVIGGGKTEDFDWLGIYSTRLNAQLLATIFRGYSEEKIITNPWRDKVDLKKKIIIGAGWRPGWSTDFVCVSLAKRYGVKTILNLSNIPYIYNRDPRKFKSAKPFKTISWKDYKKMIGGKWRPGMNLPFDPIASKLGEKLKLKVVVMKGTDFLNFDNFLKGKKFKGTLVE